MSLVGILAEVAHNLNYEGLSEEVISNTKLHILDTIGVGFHASTLQPLFEPVIKILQTWEGNGPCTVFGKKSGFPARYAAFINSMMLISSSYMEDHRSTLSHPCCPIFSSALAAGEEQSANGKNFIAAVVAGYEIFLRVCGSVSPSHMIRGLQPTGTIAPVGAAVTCGKLIGLNKEQMKHAIAHAVNFSGAGLIEAHAAKPYFNIHIGTNVWKGFLAALMAKEGVVGCETILEGGSVNEKGFLQAFSNEYNVDIIEKGLGSTLQIQDTGFCFDNVATFSRTPMESVLEIVRENRIELDDIETINIFIMNVIYNFTQRRISTAKETAREAYYYIPFHIAMALLKGKVEAEMYTDENFKNPEVQKIMRKVQFTGDPKLDEEYKRSGTVTTSLVELTTKDNKTYKKKLDYWRGDTKNPATKEELLEKFRRLALKATHEQIADKIVHLVEHLETVTDIRVLGELIRPAV